MTIRQNAITIEAAASADQSILHAIAMRSKAYWGYDDAFMTACADELRIPDGYFGKYPVYVARAGRKILGYYVLAPEKNSVSELEMLFVDPEAIGKGIGAMLLTHAKNQARKQGAKRLKVQSDPYAAPFYAAMGFVKTGESPSGSIPGRTLPEMEKTLAFQLQIIRRLPAIPAFDQFERNTLSFIQAGQPRLFDGGNMDKRIRAALIRLNKTKPLGGIEPLYCTASHSKPLHIMP